MEETLQRTLSNQVRACIEDLPSKSFPLPMRKSRTRPLYCQLKKEGKASVGDVFLPLLSPPIIIMRPVFFCRTLARSCLLFCLSRSFVHPGLKSNLILPFDRLFPTLLSCLDVKTCLFGVLNFVLDLIHEVQISLAQMHD